MWLCFDEESERRWNSFNMIEMKGWWKIIANWMKAETKKFSHNNNSNNNSTDREMNNRINRTLNVAQTFLWSCIFIISLELTHFLGKFRLNIKLDGILQKIEDMFRQSKKFLAKNKFHFEWIRFHVKMRFYYCQHLLLSIVMPMASKIRWIIVCNLNGQFSLKGIVYV